jgi:hypothetical protein
MAIRVERSISDEGDGQENRIAASSANAREIRLDGVFTRDRRQMPHIGLI